MNRIGIMAASTLLLATVALAHVSVATGASPNAWPAGLEPVRTSSISIATGVRTVQVRRLTFDRPFQTHTLLIRTQGGTRLTVDTQDCCIVGDHWGVTLVNPGSLPIGRPRAGTPTAYPDAVQSTCGTGTSQPWSGALEQPTKAGTYVLHIYYCAGVDMFPAGMSVRLRYDGNLTAAVKG